MTERASRRTAPGAAPRRAERPALRLTAATFLVAMLAASCGTDDGTRATGKASTTATTTSTADPSIDATETTVATSAAETETGGTEETGVQTTTTTIDDLLRLAPAQDDDAALVRWDRNGITMVGSDGEPRTEPIDGLAQVASIPGSAVVFQTFDDERVIWSLADDGPTGLLVVPDGDRLELEGGGFDASGEPVVLYQHHVFGSPEDTRSRLLSFRPSDGVVTEIAPTGGWESGVDLSTLHVLGPGQGDTAVARWSAEGWEWVEILDVQTGDVVFDSQDLQPDCFPGDEGCPAFRGAVPFDGDIIGLGPVWNEERGFIDAFGLWHYDTATAESELLESWAWDNGLWYVEDLFLIDDSLLVVSLQDEPDGGDPLPALMFDLVSGASWTLPDASFVRPAHIG